MLQADTDANSVELSVLIPVYNAEKHMPRVLKSVLSALPAQGAEVICVDDGSRDSSAAVISCHAENDPRIVLHSQPNGGPSSARNTALKLARGRYITFVNSEDVVDPTYFEIMLDAAKRDGADCVITGYSTMEGKKITPCPLVKNPEVHEPTPALLARLPRYSWGCLYTADVLRRSQAAFPARIRHGEDSVFNYCVRPHCAKIVLLPECGYYHTPAPLPQPAVLSANTLEVLGGARHLAEYYQSGHAPLESDKENLLRYVVHSLRRVHDLVPHATQPKAARKVEEILKFADILPVDLDRLRGGDAGMLRSILRGGDGLSTWYYIRRFFRVFS